MSEPLLKYIYEVGLSWTTGLENDFWALKNKLAGGRPAHRRRATTPGQLWFSCSAAHINSALRRRSCSRWRCRVVAVVAVASAPSPSPRLLVPYTIPATASHVVAVAVSVDAPSPPSSSLPSPSTRPAGTPLLPRLRCELGHDCGCELGPRQPHPATRRAPLCCCPHPAGRRAPFAVAVQERSQGE